MCIYINIWFCIFSFPPPQLSLLAERQWRSSLSSAKAGRGWKATVPASQLQSRWMQAIVEVCKSYGATRPCNSRYPAPSVGLHTRALHCFHACPQLLLWGFHPRGTVSCVVGLSPEQAWSPFAELLDVNPPAAVFELSPGGNMQLCSTYTAQRVTENRPVDERPLFHFTDHVRGLEKDQVENGTVQTPDTQLKKIVTFLTVIPQLFSVICL